MGLPLALYYLANGSGPEAEASSGDKADVRPAGPLIWLHAPQARDHPIVADLAARLCDLEPDLWLLVTSNEPAGADWPDQCLHCPIPNDTRADIKQFLDHWRPSVAAWFGDVLRPGLVCETTEAGVPLYLLDTGNALATTRFQSRIPGLRRAALRSFDAILAGDEATAEAFRLAGANTADVEVSGVLEHGIPALPCLEAERDTFAQLFAARPVWLAAEIDDQEFAPVLDAHVIALRRTHRLLLILVPSDLSKVPMLESLLAERDLRYELRSSGAEPDAEMQVYVADTDEEMGLWYRLAPTTFLGHTLGSGGGVQPHPFHAAALGSVVLHGPRTDHMREEFLRLNRASASREVKDAAELAAGIDTLLAPDRAAEMAHSAWQVCSAGAEVTEKVVDLLSSALARRGQKG